MYCEKIIGVVVPCYNEDHLIGQVVETMPNFVDCIYLIDDCSTDHTRHIIEEYANTHSSSNIKGIFLDKNQGVGAAIAAGYKAAREDNMDVTVVMAGDAQMDPDDLESIILPVINDQCDYTKGNRLFSGQAWEMIPRIRYLGNAMLSLLTKIASGYWHISDSQSGYTAINLKALETIDWDKMYKRYGQPNDLLVRLNIYNFRVRDVPIRPVYGIGEKSGIKPLRMIPKLSWLLFRLFWYRMFHKYVIRDFHPLVFFYSIGTILFTPGVILGCYLFIERIFVGPVVATSALFAAFLFITGLQLLLFGMWMDMEANKELK
jgi:glycosyltransferase involved in cell wall biosynthesis